MPFPEGVPSVPVRYSITSPAGGGPGEGTLQLMPTVPAIRVPGADGVFTGGGTYRFVDGLLVDGEGEQVRLLPTNVDGANPTVWAWLGIESVIGAQPRHFYFTLDADAESVDLGAIQQLAPDLTQYLAVPGSPPTTHGGELATMATWMPSSRAWSARPATSPRPTTTPTGSSAKPLPPKSRAPTPPTTPPAQRARRRRQR